MRRFMVYAYPLHQLLELSNEDNTARACGTNRGGEKCLQDFGGETRRDETTWNPQEQAGRVWTELI